MCLLSRVRESVPAQDKPAMADRAGFDGDESPEASLNGQGEEDDGDDWQVEDGLDPSP